ncbi:MAG: DUF484 family protein [Acetobacteraceae bacterium]|nr:DUF484 family protein [Acetobacteraceae bacterium]
MRRTTRHPAAEPETDPDEAAAVEAFLRAHPDFLASRPHLYAVLAPPRRVHGERLADHMAAMIEQARAREAALIASRRAEARLAERVRRAVLALLAARSAAEMVEVVEAEWPAILGVDVVSLAVEGRSTLGLRRVPRGFVRRTLGQAGAVVRDRPTEAEAIHGEAASLVAADVLARCTLEGATGLVAFGWREAERGGPAFTAEPFAFLARVLEACLARAGG